MSTGKAAKLLGISVKTLQRWEQEGRLILIARTNENCCVYRESQIKK
ncbi:MerR family DNA-binding transcriptional regulator [Chromatium okenii]